MDSTPRAPGRPPGTPGRLMAWARRHPRLTAAGGVFLALWLIGSCAGHRSPASVPPAPGPARAAQAAAAAPQAAEPAPAAAPAEAPVPTVAPVAPAAPAPPPAPTVRSAPTVAAPALPTGGKCADYASQAEAQAALRRDPARAGRLDDDHDGIACEKNPGPFDKAVVARR